MRPAHLALLVVLNFFWAATLSVYKVLEPHLAPGGIVTVRFGLAGLCLLALWPILPGQAPRGWDLVKTLVMGLLLFVLGQRLQVLGNQLGTAGNSSVLMALEPVLASAGAAIFLREHIGPRRWTGFGLGMLGVALLNGVWREDFKLTGLVASLIFISSFVCEAAYSIIAKPIISRAGFMKVLTLSLLAGTLGNILIDGGGTFAAARAMPLPAWLWLGYLALICTVVGYGSWFMVMREAEVNVVALTIFIQPVAGVAVAALWLGESLHWGQLWGGLMIVAGLVFGLSRQVKRD